MICALISSVFNVVKEQTTKKRRSNKTEQECPEIFDIIEYNTEDAVRHHYDDGPTFGAGPDICITDRCNITQESHCLVEGSGDTTYCHEGDILCGGSSDKWLSRYIHL